MPEYGLWEYILFDLEKGIPGYTEEFILERLDIDQVLMKWIMLQNALFIEGQDRTARSFYFHPSYDGKKKFKYEQIPYPLIEEEKEKEKQKVFDRKKAWESAPKYDLNRLGASLGSLM